MMTFKVGDIITCVDDYCILNGTKLNDIKQGVSYKFVRKISENIICISDLSNKVIGNYFTSRFVLATEPYTATQVGDKEDDI